MSSKNQAKWKWVNEMSDESTSSSLFSDRECQNRINQEIAYKFALSLLWCFVSRQRKMDFRFCRIWGHRSSMLRIEEITTVDENDRSCSFPTPVESHDSNKVVLQTIGIMILSKRVVSKTR